MGTQTQAGEPQSIDKNYTEVIKSNVEYDNKYIQGKGISTKIVYYCRECNKLIAPKRIGKKFQFRCSECKGTNVSFGTEKSIASHYHLPYTPPEEEEKI